jgi:hypothetical protein
MTGGDHLMRDISISHRQTPRADMASRTLRSDLGRNGELCESSLTLPPRRLVLPARIGVDADPATGRPVAGLAADAIT